MASVLYPDGKTLQKCLPIQHVLLCAVWLDCRAVAGIFVTVDSGLSSGSGSKDREKQLKSRDM